MHFLSTKKVSLNASPEGAFYHLGLMYKVYSSMLLIMIRSSKNFYWVITITGQVHNGRGGPLVNKALRL